MKKFLISTSSVAVMIAFSGMASAQQADATGQVAQSDNSGAGQTENARAQVTNESALAILDSGVGGNLREYARAEVGDGVNASSDGDEVGFPNVGHAGATANGANSSAQFQVGNNNSSINMQEGINQESAMLQIGDENAALISQRTEANEAAITQVGLDNNSALVQDGWDNAGVVAVHGDHNSAVGYQTEGDDNILAIAQKGDNNSQATFQEGSKNTAASLQSGNENASFISQGGGTSFIATAINLDTFAGGVPTHATIGGSGIGSLGATSNSAANLQLGNGNSSAILQTGGSNEAINYQNSM